ncbi:Acetate kinase (Acetokinase) [Legionella steelei]|uniref:Acetate kinase n=1 Tax=Legionella steelei TaxID=947033 RepID=A0A0W0ZCL8_9GAMM|nr:acetate/propionate family kinase [Legionella steelei]KTD66913.1 Acetate kinase (Acetokinase) [Legionella steelei]
MHKVILVINSGSSSIKFSLFACQQKLNLLYHGEIEGLFESPYLTILNATHAHIFKQKIVSQGHEAGLKSFFDWFEQLSNSMTLTAVGHRVVHGGMYFFHPTLVTDEAMKTMASLNPLAPLHQPHNLEAIRIIKTIYPKLPQVACFDTTFHRTQEKLATLFAIPRKLTDEGVLRYGFHGISYEYIASVMTQHMGETGNKRVIVAHLGNGASMCAMYQCQSVATSMGFTALDGLMMGTRCGRIDPGVILYLIQEKKYSPKEMEHLLYKESGLLGVSGISNDVRELLANSDVNAQEAIDLFCYRAALEVGSLSTALKGCDALVFTAGIGENAAIIRKKICEQLSWLGIKINDQANEMNSVIISDNESKIRVSVIPTNEEYMIAKHTWNIVETN